MFTLDNLCSAVRDYIVLHPNDSYEIVVGTDSRTSANHALFVTSLVVRRVGNGGIFFYTRFKEKKEYTIRERIWKETMVSITLAQEIRSRMKESLGEEIFWNKQIQFHHIHLDVGVKGPTRELVDGVTGVVKGFGFVPVIKPDSYGAFVVADLYT
ncbi:MAG: hypothetical protein A3C80_04245 [Candidatus Ryanbacteria bacterium RIFCSPHIGHO2_02_FULL_45_43]|uniref:DUF458 domain-containing protein n=1 Tax=Candidatus Ryanbacteria bacterium RIFCSPHIGHO2_01_45_13 TaxID=1802112 RepID=A0A1G2FYA6_9BACT|nr:MAG: hypothetical protein A2718_00275 [Candidatus Ryanbacteria bacterium RIFCSPHIGHO2_01_FULL_44_130]OGZ42827.1 MAG: hypothetical protein A2W41_00635 [Candidatus Ryanbacteria bacterium RIFCSPHIGHO2_01_45_13]OGZ48263.1 MAG: hypothetical protein A3C80_04245 [Candidatus Ryanbacteria bacterium RIFCSPHIGHO2_02_FULL_45_43]OGZ50039.1 MAG: hypothetical protein A3E55_01905 [Candidatus Ryanbacteria bacterium RIFCSPHIGHO2_12_FULL_44_20]OGZ51497.1 MAG: hypothetical protein A3A17_01855 [Candidatus Ryanba